MNAWASLDQAAEIGPLEAVLMDIARALQPTPTQHRQAEDHYEGLARHVDGGQSPLKDKVPDIYPSGSFAIRAAVRSSISRDQHDVDAVLELDVPAESDPKWVLDTLYTAIKGEPGSRYYDFDIVRNSRCVTVIYPDGVTVDLMPVVRIQNAPERVAELFHHKPETGEKYRKEVNPKGFADHFNAHVGESRTFAKRFDSRRYLVEGRTYEDLLAYDGQRVDMAVVEKAETAPLPDYVPLDQKSPRVVALQLLKRFRDKRFRKLDHKGRRKPPSVVMAALALDAGFVTDSLLDELTKIAIRFRDEIRKWDRQGKLTEVRNPAHQPDLFTDRWPESIADQRLWADDLDHLLSQLGELRRIGFDPVLTSKILTDLFGESASKRAVEEHYTANTNLMKAGRLGVTPQGGIKPVSKLSAPATITGAVAGAGVIMPARANTNMGGFLPDDDD